MFAAVERERLPIGASLVAIGSGVVWSIGAIMSKKADGADAFQYLLWRAVGVLVVMELIAALQRKPFPAIRAWRSGRARVFANIGLFLASIAFVYAVKTTTAANAAFLSSLTPLVAVVFAKFLGERLAPSTVVALAIGVSGLIVTMVSDLEAGNMAGNLAAFSSSIGFALYSTSVRTDPTRDWSPVLPGYSLLMILVCTVIIQFTGKPMVPPAADMAYAIVHGAVVIVVGTLMFNSASRHVPAVPMTVFAQAEMVFVPFWAWLLLSQTPKGWTIVGGAMIFCAVVGKAIYDTSGPRKGQPSEITTAPDVPLL